jgi:hypothetical protein
MHESISAGKKMKAGTRHFIRATSKAAVTARVEMSPRRDISNGLSGKLVASLSDPRCFGSSARTLPRCNATMVYMANAADLP